MAENQDTLDIAGPKPSAAGEGLAEGALESFLDYSFAASPIAGAAEYPMNKSLDFFSHGTGVPMMDQFLLPLLNQHPDFQKATRDMEVAPPPSLLNNALTDRLLAGIKAHKYTEKYYPGESMISMASKAGEAMKTSFLHNKGEVALSPVNLGSSVSQAFTTDAWHRFADFATNRIAYHTTKMAIPMLVGAAFTRAAGPGGMEASFGLQSMGHTARELADNQTLTPAQKTEATMMKAGADALFAHYYTALPGIAQKLTPWSEGLMNDLGKESGPVLLAGIKAALSEGIHNVIAKKMGQDFINGASNQLLHILIEQHYKMKDWNIAQAIIAITEA